KGRLVVSTAFRLPTIAPYHDIPSASDRGGAMAGTRYRLDVRSALRAVGHKRRRSVERIDDERTVCARRETMAELLRERGEVGLVRSRHDEAGRPDAGQVVGRTRAARWVIAWNREPVVEELGDDHRDAERSLGIVERRRLAEVVAGERAVAAGRAAAD